MSEGAASSPGLPGLEGRTVSTRARAGLASLVRRASTSAAQISQVSDDVFKSVSNGPPVSNSRKGTGVAKRKLHSLTSLLDAKEALQSINQNPPNNASTSGVRQKLQDVLQSFKAQLDCVRSRPTRTLMPAVLCLVVLVALGVTGVLVASRDAATQERWKVHQGLAYQYAEEISGFIKSSSSATASLAARISEQPNCTYIQQRWTQLASEAIGWVNSTTPQEMALAPAGVLWLMHPPPAGGGTPAYIGLDLLKNETRRDDTLSAIAAGRMTLRGPYELVEGGVGAIAYYPVFATPPTSSDTLFGCPFPRHECEGPPCFKPDTGQYFFGIVQTIIRVDALDSHPAAPLRRLANLGYRYRLVKPVPGKTEAELITSSKRLPRRHVDRTIAAYDALWVLQVEPEAGWTPEWRDPCLAAVVLGAVVVALLLLRTLIAREQYYSLLTQLLPRCVMRHLRTKGRSAAYVQAFESVTVLFSDVVGYTDMSSSMTALDVVTLLNELYGLYDSLLAKFGLYKVEELGDCYMVVGGAPEREDDPEATAMRVALLGVEMLRVTQEFVSTAVPGHKLQIRVGIHSGPAVAAVIGKTSLHYTLLGDTVNVASRMESTGLPMRMQASAATAQLLSQASVQLHKEAMEQGHTYTPPFHMDPRGDVSVKGKGIMATYWIRPSGEEFTNLCNGMSMASVAMSLASVGGNDDDTSLAGGRHSLPNLALTYERPSAAVETTSSVPTSGQPYADSSNRSCGLRMLAAGLGGGGVGFGTGTVLSPVQSAAPTLEVPSRVCTLGAN